MVRTKKERAICKSIFTYDGNYKNPQVIDTCILTPSNDSKIRSFNPLCILDFYHTTSYRKNKTGIV